LSILLLSSIATAQAPAECATSECSVQTLQPARSTDPQFLIDAAAIYQLKRQFVEALQRFVRAQAGTFGDEGPELDRSVSAMESSLSKWDAAVEALRVRAARMKADPAVRLATAVVLLDRLRVSDAIGELEAAARYDSGRVEVHALGALAYRLAGRPAESARALQRAAALDPSNPTIFYAMAQPSLNPPGSEAAAQAMRGFQRALRTSGAPARGAATVGPFERIDLLRQAGGVAPVFAEARYVEGFALLTAGDYPNAVARLRGAIPLDPLVNGAPDLRERRVQDV
jgi:tetratricopeptide (TPR) repeat protein